MRRTSVLASPARTLDAVFMRRSRWALATFVTVAAITTAALDQATTPSAGAAVIDSASPIEHVVIIYQENHTFDNVLGAVCQQRETPCNRYTGSVTSADGVTVQNKVDPDVVPDVAHSPWQQQQALVNEWDQMNGCTASSNHACISHYKPSAIPNLAQLANTYAVPDATYAVGDDSSFGAHVELGAGTDDGFWGTNPQTSKSGVRPLLVGECASHKDARWRAAGSTKVTFQPSCLPLRDGSGAYRATPVPYAQSIMEQLEAASLHWRIYNGSSATKTSPAGLWNVCSYFAWCVKNRQTVTYNPGYAAFQTDAANGTLPAVAMIPASGSISQHNG